MPAQTKLQGVIELSADTTKAEKQVADIPRQVEQEASKTSQATAETVGKSIASALTGAKEPSKTFASFLGTEVQSSVTRSMSSLFGIFGEMGQAFGKALEKSITAAIKASAPKPNLSSATGGSAVPPGKPPAIEVPPIVASWLPPIPPKFGVPPIVGWPLAQGAGGAGAGGAAGATEGGVVGAASGAGGLAAMAGPAGIAAFITLQLASGLMTMANQVKDVVRQLMDFGRSLADVSVPMAAAFAVFDVNIMLLKKQIGDALAPAMDELLTSVLSLAGDALPTVIFALQALTMAMVNSVRMVDAALHLSGIMESVAGYNAFKGAMDRAGKGGLESPDSLKNIAQDVLFLLDKGVKYLEKYLPKLPDSTGEDLKKSFGFSGLNDFLNRNDSDQQKFAQQLNRRWVAQQAQGVQAINLGIH